MQLGQLYENFGTSSPEIQAKFISEYRLRRAEDMAKPSTLGKKTTKAKATKTPVLALSAEEKALMKMLGIRQKDVLALRAVTTPQVESVVVEEDEGTDLLNDSTFEEGDDE